MSDGLSCLLRNELSSSHRLSLVEPIDNHAIAIVAIQRQRMPVSFVNAKGVHLVILLKSFCHAESLRDWNHPVGSAVEDGLLHIRRIAD